MVPRRLLVFWVVFMSLSNITASFSTSPGGYLGLVNSSQLTKNKFVAIEFDTRLDLHFNDPNDNHVDWTLRASPPDPEDLQTTSKSILLFLCNNSSSAFTKQNQNHKSWQPMKPLAQPKPQKSVDANDDGKISVSELGNMLKALGSNVSADELQRVMGDLYRLHSFVAASMAAALKPMLHDASSRAESEESQRWRW